MIRRINNILRSIFISVEMICVLFLVALYQYVPNFYLKIGQWYLNEGNWIVGVGINSGLLVFSLAQAKEILFPVNNSMNLLRGWPNYILLKDTSLVGIFYCAITTLFAFMGFIFKKDINSGFLGLLFLSDLAVSIIATGSLYFAHINVKIFLEQSETS